MAPRAKDNVSLDPTDEDIDETVERTPTVLILDTSGSMTQESVGSDGKSKENIERLNEGLDFFRDEVLEKEHASARVDVGVIEFGSGAEIRKDFTHIKNWTPPTLTASGKTPMGEAIELAIDMTEDVKTFYANEGIPYNRPIFWLLTDGKPTDMNQGDDKWNQVQQQLERATEDNHFELFAMGVGEADMDTLNALVEPTSRPALKIKEGMFAEYFAFLSNSLEDASQEEGTPDQVGDTDDLKEFIEMG